VTNNTIIGNNVHFNGMKIIGCGKVRIGDNFHSGEMCLILSQNHKYESDKIPYNDEYECQDVVIENNIWLGARVIILPGVTIGEGAIIQAGSVVVNDIRSCAIAGGHPAKVFKSRDKERYYDLKRKGKFG